MKNDKIQLESIIKRLDGKLDEIRDMNEEKDVGFDFNLKKIEDLEKKILEQLEEFEQKEKVNVQVNEDIEA